MLTSKFILYEDETFFSIGSRIWPRLGFPNGRAFCNALFGREGVKAQSLLRRAPLTVPTMAGLLGVSSEVLYQDHTFVPYYEAARVLPRASDFSFEARQGVCYYAATRYVAERKRPLRMCVACIAEDMAVLGEPYWRRTHQLAGVVACPTHKLWLVTGCARCNWTPNRDKLTYPTLTCPNGHSLRASRPSDTVSLSAEVDFAKWSAELLDFQLGENRENLLESLWRMAAQVGWRGTGWRATSEDVLSVVHGHKHPALTHGLLLLGRVNDVNYPHVASVAMGTRAITKSVHPAAVVLCIKAMLGPDVKALDALKWSDEQAMPPRWRWRLLRGAGDKKQVQFLMDHVNTRAKTNDVSFGAYERRVASELGSSQKFIVELRKKFLMFKTLLEQLNPHLYNAGPESRLNEILRELGRLKVGLELSSATALERQLCSQVGMPLGTFGSYKRRSPLLVQRLFELRPDLYSDEGRIAYQIERLKKFNHLVVGESRLDYEERVSVWLGVQKLQVRLYKRLYPRFAECLKAARPELYLPTDQLLLTRYLKLVEEWGDRTEGSTITSYEHSLAKKAGVGGKQLYLARKAYPELAQKLLEVRPDLYESPALNGHVEFPMSAMIDIAKKYGPKVRGDTVGEFETNLGAKMGRSRWAVYEYRKSSREMAEVLFDLRPDLYLTCRTRSALDPKNP